MSMTSCNHMCYHPSNGSQEPFFNKPMLNHIRQGCHKTVRTVTTLPWAAGSYLISNQEYPVSFWTASWVSHEFEQTRAVLLKLSIFATQYPVIIFIAPLHTITMY
ncbi:hypothetical protein TNCV_980441 [Trichonephila clavipes]|uniref:Uncharacterized protein n=1 Tax=Trichonephila clavipes TaxID=2585209 RepID=A0A8X6VD37_TRICX|nr:hypothetical protein TNCV_980441 [Trichonephila clavipes]